MTAAAHVDIFSVYTAKPHVVHILPNSRIVIRLHSDPDTSSLPKPPKEHFLASTFAKPRKRWPTPRCPAGHLPRNRFPDGYVKVGCCPHPARADVEAGLQKPT